MALSIIKDIEKFNPLRPQLPLKLQTDAQVAVAAVKARRDYTFTGFPAEGKLLHVNFAGISYTYLFLAVPTSDLHIYRNSGSEYDYVYDWAIAEVIPKLLRNYELMNAYEISTSSTSPSDITIRLTARNKGSAWSLSGTTDSADITIGTTVAGVDQVNNANFKCLCDVYSETSYMSGDFKRLVQVDADPDNSSNFSFALEEVISFTETDVPAYNLSAVSFYTKNLKRIFVQFAEKYGSPATVKRNYRSPAVWDEFAVVLNAALSFEKFPGHTFKTSYFENVALRKFLTNMPRVATILPEQLQLLGFWSSSPDTTMRVNCKVYFDDGTTESYIALTKTGHYNKLCMIPVSYYALDIASHELPGKAILKYDVWVSYSGSSGMTSETMTFNIDLDYHVNKHVYLFQNSFGCMETVAFTGDRVEKPIYSKEEYYLQLDHDYSVSDAEVRELNRTYLVSVEQTSGISSNEYLKYYKEMLNSLAAYELVGTNFLRLSIDNKDHIQLDEEKAFGSIELKYQYAFRNTGGI